MKDPAVGDEETTEEPVSSVKKSTKRRSINAMPTMYLMASDAR